MTIFVAGANGFIGEKLCEELLRRHVPFVSGVRRNCEVGDMSSQVRQLGDIRSLAQDSNVLQGASVVVHLANMAAVSTKNSMEEGQDEIFEVNVKGTEKALYCAAHNGVKRFVYISSLKAITENTSNNKGVSALDVACPECVYGQSKLKAENVIESLAPQLGLEYVIIRPPLVYGPGVSGTFNRLIRLVQKGLPLPFKCVNNARSMVYVGNLVDLIIKCFYSPKAANKTFMVSDGQDLSLPQLVGLIASEFDKRDPNFWFPESLFWHLGVLFGKQDMVQKLFGSLVVEMSSTQALLDWQPPYTVEQGLSETIRAFKQLAC